MPRLAIRTEEIEADYFAGDQYVCCGSDGVDWCGEWHASIGSAIACYQAAYAAFRERFPSNPHGHAIWERLIRRYSFAHERCVPLSDADQYAIEQADG